MTMSTLKRNIGIPLICLTFPLFNQAQFQHEVNLTNGSVETEPIQEIDSIYFDIPSSSMHIRMLNSNLQTYQWSNINNMTFSGSASGQVDALDCNNAVLTGNLTAGQAASNVTFSVSYSGGNGAAHNGQTVNSTGVTGLMATTPSGNFSNGQGTLVYEIMGTPNAAGMASFELNIGGQSCTVQFQVDQLMGEISSLDCINASVNGSLVENSAASGVSFMVNYTGGNGGAHSGQVVASSGVIGLTATLNAGSFNVGNGNLTYQVTGTPSSSGIAEFLLDIGGQTCTVSINVAASGGGGCPTLAIGDAFGGGIVVDVNYPNSPCGYLIVREDNDDNSFTFIMGAGTCLDGNPVTGPNPPNLAGVGDGEINSNWLVQNCVNTPADVCNGITHAGFTDWFLPSKDEVELRLGNWSNNNYPPTGTSQQFFTSSFLETNFTINTGGGTFNNLVKLAEPGVVSSSIIISGSLTRPVRCVRSF
jgi:hypothetical protein